jgi:hypothetical protein
MGEDRGRQEVGCDEKGREEKEREGKRRVGVRREEMGWKELHIHIDINTMKRFMSTVTVS